MDLVVQTSRDEKEFSDELDRKLSKASLYHFTKALWHVIEPGNDFVDGWHIRTICEHLEAATRFEISNLIINMPPRHMKSILVSVMWPAWVWATHPERRFIFGSYNAILSARDAVKMRTIIESDTYKELIQPDWELKDDQNTKGKFENTKTGFRFSTSVGGGLTGEGGDYLVVDDPQNSIDIHSEAYREEAKLWWDQAMSTRANNPDRVCRIIIQQRLHADDLTGHILSDKTKAAKYERLILQAEYEANGKVKSRTSLPWKDPRTTDGAPLWPERFTANFLKDLKVDLGTTGSSGQLQQDPQPPDGGLFKETWWKWFNGSPSDIIEIVQFWDCAEKPGITNDFSVCATWARTPSGFYLMHLFRDKVTYPVLKAKAKALYDLWKPNAMVIEDKSAGASLIQDLRSETTYPILAFNPGRQNKEVRAAAATPMVESGKCHLPKDPVWKDDLNEFITEHQKFPVAAHDDTVDTTSMMVAHFQKMSGSAPRIRML